jgi:hypothetical protein
LEDPMPLLQIHAEPLMVCHGHFTLTPNNRLREGEQQGHKNCPMLREQRC